MPTGRNSDKFISREGSRRAVLQGMLKGGYTYDGRSGLPTSAVAYLAFPGYAFRSPQGAALAVSGLVRSMCDEKLISRSSNRGYYLTREGASAARAISVCGAPAGDGSGAG